MSDEDLVERLRGIAVHSYLGRSVIEEAADRIEQLTAKLAKAEGGMREIAAECGCSIARATLAALKGETEPNEYERKVTQMKEDFPNGI